MPTPVPSMQTSYFVFKRRQTLTQYDCCGLYNSMPEALHFINGRNSLEVVPYTYDPNQIAKPLSFYMDEINNNRD